LGDRTYIEDPKFFGWTFDQATGKKIPYREEIVVTETIHYFEEPTKNTIKVQNFKT
jgi:hypothetical protein